MGKLSRSRLFCRCCKYCSTSSTSTIGSFILWVVVVFGFGGDLVFWRGYLLLLFLFLLRVRLVVRDDSNTRSSIEFCVDRSTLRIVFLVFSGVGGVDSVGCCIAFSGYYSGIFKNCGNGCCVGGAYCRSITNTRSSSSSIGYFLGRITCSMEFVVSSGVGGVNFVGGVYSSGIFDSVGNRYCVGGACGRIGNCNIFLLFVRDSVWCRSTFRVRWWS